MQEILPDIATELEKQQPVLRRYIRSIVRDASVADDVLQEVMCRAVRNYRELQDNARLAAWLMRIATNACIDHFRKSGTRARFLEGWAGVESAALPGTSAAHFERKMEYAEMSACVQRFLEKLPVSYQVVMILHDVEGMTNPEIADMLGTSLGTVKIRLHRARKRLRRILQDACQFQVDERGVLVCEPKEEKHIQGMARTEV